VCGGRERERERAHRGHIAAADAGARPGRCGLLSLLSCGVIASWAAWLLDVQIRDTHNDELGGVAGLS